MKVETVKAKNIVSLSAAANTGFKPGELHLFVAGRQMGKSYMIDQMINQLYGFKLPNWAVMAAQRRNDQKAWWKRFTG